MDGSPVVSSPEDRRYLEDDVDVVSQRVQVPKGQPERDGVGVEEGTGLKANKAVRTWTRFCWFWFCLRFPSDRSDGTFN